MDNQPKNQTAPVVVSIAEIMADNLGKIADALNQLRSVPLPKELIYLYVQKKTRLSHRDIESVFDAVEELNKKTTVTKP